MIFYKYCCCIAFYSTTGCKDYFFYFITISNVYEVINTQIFRSNTINWRKPT